MTATTETAAKAKTRLVRALRGGQITIPVDFRRELGIDEETLLRMTLKDGELIIKPVRVDDPPQGSPGLRELYEYFAPLRAEILASGVTEEELFADIDSAVEEVRAARRGKLK